MTMKRLSIVFLLLLIARASVALAAEKPLVLDLWPGVAPGEKGDIGPEKLQPPKKDAKPTVKILTNVSRPTITVYRPEKAKNTGAAIVICPGGGYYILAMDLEGEEVAAWLNSIGVTGILLKYRVPMRKGQETTHLAPLQDAQRAMGLVRGHAQAWDLDPHRIGILGFSAGGHLAAVTSTNYDKRRYDALDDSDKVSCRPDFAVLIYPGYLGTVGHLPAEIRVDAQTPPVFLAHAGDDRALVEGSIAMYQALWQAKVPAELHVYASGGHGFGLRPTGKPAPTWPKRCEEWLRERGIIKADAGH